MADGELVEVTVERLADGEVSPYLVDVVAPGDQLEVRGPVGGWFVWRPEQASRCCWSPVAPAWCR